MLHELPSTVPILETIRGINTRKELVNTVMDRITPDQLEQLGPKAEKLIGDGLLVLSSFPWQVFELQDYYAVLRPHGKKKNCPTDDQLHSLSSVFAGLGIITEGLYQEENKGILWKIPKYEERNQEQKDQILWSIPKELYDELHRIFPRD